MAGNRDFLTPVDTTFRQMYLVSQNEFDNFKRYQDTNLMPRGPPPDAPPDASPGLPPGSPPGSSPAPPVVPSLSATETMNQQISGEEAPHFPCTHKTNNGSRCKSIFDTQENLDIHIQTVHQTHPLSQAAIRNVVERVDQSLHSSIDNESRINSTVKAKSHQNIANTILVQSDNRKCNLCSFKGRSPEDLDNHIRNDHVNHPPLASPNLLRPKITHSPKLTPRAISLNRVESYDEQNQSRNNEQTMDTSTIEPVAEPSGTSPPRPRRRGRPRGPRKKIEPSRFLTRRNRGKIGRDAVRVAVDGQPRPKVKVAVDDHSYAIEDLTENDTLDQPSRQTQRSKSKRTADVQQLEIRPRVNDEEQRKNAFDLAVGRKKHKTNHTFQPPSQVWSTVPKKSKKKKKKKVKRINRRNETVARKRINRRNETVARYKGRTVRRPKTKADPSIKRNVAALGLAGY